MLHSCGLKKHRKQNKHVKATTFNRHLSFNVFERNPDGQKELTECMRGMIKSITAHKGNPDDFYNYNISQAQLGRHMEPVDDVINLPNFRFQNTNFVVCLWEPMPFQGGHFMLLYKLVGDPTWYLVDSLGRTRQGGGQGQVVNVNDKMCYQDTDSQACGSWVLYNMMCNIFGWKRAPTIKALPFDGREDTIRALRPNQRRPLKTNEKTLFRVLANNLHFYLPRHELYNIHLA